MKRIHLPLLAFTTLVLAVSTHAGVKVTSSAEPVEKIVAFKAANGYVTIVTGGFLTVGGEKIGSKQVFTIIDMSGGNLADGDTVRIRYTPHSATSDQSKSSYWAETSDGIKRNSDGSSFKLKVVDGKYAFVAPSGKFLSYTANTFVFSEKQADALFVEVVDATNALNKGKKPTAEKTPTE